MSKEAEQRRNAKGLKKKIKAIVDEYIREAEHQDGPGYWENFKTMEEIFQDMSRYSVDMTKPITQ